MDNNASRSGGSQPTRIPVAAPPAADPEIVIPVIEEQLVVTKKEVEKATVRVVKEVMHHEEIVQTGGAEESITVRSIPKNIYVDSAPPTRQEGDTTILSVLREVVVVETRLLLVEEVHITRTRTQTNTTQTVSLRTEAVSVVRTETGARLAVGNPAQPESL